MTALEKLKKKNSELKVICVGLDTDINKIPEHLKGNKNPVVEFNRQIIEHTLNYAGAYKINFAFYEKDGTKGFENIIDTIKLIPDDVLIIADAKRGDIGNTSEMYATAIFELLMCDAVTIHPYMGLDSVSPFLKRKDKLNFILALTSNKSADDFEKLKTKDGDYIYQKVIKKVIEWNTNNNCGIVFGATQINDLKENIALFNELPVLLPGIGAQGGSIEDVINIFKNNNRLNLLINSSRGIIYSNNGQNFAISAEKEIIRLNEAVKNILEK